MRTQSIVSYGTAFLEIAFVVCGIGFVIIELPSLFKPANVDLQASSATINNQIRQLTTTANGRELWIQKGLSDVMSLNVETRQMRPVFGHHERPIGAWNVSTDGSTVLLAKDEREFLIYRNLEVVVNDLINFDAAMLAWLSANGVAAVRIVNGISTRCWDLSTSEPTTFDLELPDRADRLGVDPLGRFFFVSNLVGILRFYRLRSGELIKSIAAPNALSSKPSFSEDGRWFAVNLNTSVIVYNATTLEESWSIRTDERDGYHTVAFSPDGELIVISGAYAGTHIFDAATGEHQHELPTTPTIHRVCFSTDSASLYFGGMDGSISQCSLAERKMQKLVARPVMSSNSTVGSFPWITTTER